MKAGLLLLSRLPRVISGRFVPFSSQNGDSTNVTQMDDSMKASRTKNIFRGTTFILRGKDFDLNSYLDNFRMLLDSLIQFVVADYA